MKKIVILVLLAITSTCLFAQAPEKMSYQAVIRNATNQLVTEQLVGIKISVVQGTEDGTVIYSETHSKETNENGLLSLEIGTGTTADVFANIDWSAGTHFLKTEIDTDGAANYTITGVSQILSVPYALSAKTAENYAETDPMYMASEAAKISAADITKLGTLSGTNTGDQDLSSHATQTALVDTAVAIRSALSAGNLWQKNGDNVYYDGGNVGIGKTNPEAMIDVFEDGGHNFFKFTSNDNVYTHWISNRVGVHNYQLGIDGGNNRFMIANATTGNFPIVIHDEHIGINMWDPMAPLHINDFMKLEPRSTAPSAPSAGMIYFDSQDKKVKVYTGSAWENLN